MASVPHIDWRNAKLAGPGCSRSGRKLGDLKGLFKDTSAFEAMDPETPAYRVEMHAVVPEGTASGLYYGISILYPGQVGDEYFMTKGHFHSKRETAEYYWCVSGEGGLLLMDEDRNTRVEWLKPGTLHYIPGHTAHRLANTGETELVVGACWPSDAGHDYGSIAEKGFSARLLRVDGIPELVSHP